MIFHGYFRSSSAHRCRIALNIKGIKTEQKFYHLRRNGGEHNHPAYQQLNPQKLVPALSLNKDQGDACDFVLTQSLAIIEWLEDTYPTPALLSEDKDLRARQRSFAQIIACDIHPLQNLRILQYLKNDLHQEQAAVDRWCQEWIHQGLQACETILARLDQQTEFCFGEAPSLADICLVPQIYSAKRFNIDLSAMPILKRIFDTCEALPAFIAARPTEQPDAEA